MTYVIRQQAHDRTRPPVSIAELLASLETIAPGFANRVRVRLLSDQL
jgi:hypothetical protein